MSEFHLIIARKIFFPIFIVFFLGGGSCAHLPFPHLPLFYAYDMSVRRSGNSARTTVDPSWSSLASVCVTWLLADLQNHVLLQT